MHVVAFAPSLRAGVDDRGGITADGFPLTSAQVASFPAHITVPMVLAVHTQGGSDHDPHLYMVARSQEGERLGSIACTWHWPDVPGSPLKFWVSAPHLPRVVAAAGVVNIGLYGNLDDTEPWHLFPLRVFTSSPLLRPPPSPSTRM
jgi:hypothetical protein